VKKAISVFYFVTIAVCLQAQNLIWDLKFLKGRERESVQVSRTIQMETGQPIQFTITPGSSCYCYVILYDSDHKIEVYHNKLLNEEATFGPWPLNGSGTEIFYVIMSLERQSNLEDLIAAYNNNRSSDQYANNLLTEVVNLQNKASALGDAGSSFIPGGGSFRGASEEYVTHFSDKGLYVRPITIRH